jgi:four helix bundle protein
VGANYREAYRAWSKSEFIAKCGDSLRELEESAYWLELLVDGGVVPSEKLHALRSECDELRSSSRRATKANRSLLLNSSFFLF